MLIEVKTGTTIFHIDKQGRKQGELVRYYLTGGLLTRINYLDDAYHGKLFGYYSDGVLSSYCEFSHGKMHGEYTYYGPDGGILLSRWFVDDKFTNVTPSQMTHEDRLYFAISGRLPPRFEEKV